MVEIIVNKGAKCRYTTIQNWSNNIFNLVTKRAVAYEEASMEWVDGNIGSRLTMKYPSVYLMGRKAKGEVLSVAYAGKGQHQDAGAKMIHIAPETTSRITNKSVSKDGGKTTYRGLAKVAPGATGAKVNVNCDALILDEKSKSDLPDEPRLERVGRDVDDCVGLHGAIHPRAADGVRGRAQPAHPDGDGRLGWIKVKSKRGKGKKGISDYLPFIFFLFLFIAAYGA